MGRPPVDGPQRPFPHDWAEVETPSRAPHPGALGAQDLGGRRTEEDRPLPLAGPIVSDLGVEVGPGRSRVGDSLAISAVKTFVLFLVLLTVAAVLHSWSHGPLP
jgi:hypothetical protein